MGAWGLFKEDQDLCHVIEGGRKGSAQSPPDYQYLWYRRFDGLLRYCHAPSSWIWSW